MTEKRSRYDCETADVSLRNGTAVSWPAGKALWSTTSACANVPGSRRAPPLYPVSTHYMADMYMIEKRPGTVKQRLMYP
jgi:hypothetical protein